MMLSEEDRSQALRLKCQILAEQHILFTPDPDTFSPSWLTPEEAASSIEGGQPCYAFVPPHAPYDVRFMFWYEIVQADAELGAVYLYEGRRLRVDEAARLLAQTWCRRVIGMGAIGVELAQQLIEQRSPIRIITEPGDAVSA